MEKNITNLVVAAIAITLIVLSFLLLRPILMSIIFGFVLVFVLAPFYNLINKKIKSKNLSATIVTLLLIIVIIAILIVSVPLLVSESIKIFTFAQTIDFRIPLYNLFPSLADSGALAAQIDSTLHSVITDFSSSLISSVSSFLKDFPIVLLQLTVVFFTFFFVLRDKEEFIEYLKTILPFQKDIQDRLLKATKDVTISVLYGQIIIGFVQGLIAGIGFFLFGIPDAWLLMLLSVIAGVLPIVGPSIVWIPAALYLVIMGNNIAGLGVLIFGIASVVVDHILRPIIISKRLMMNSLLALLGTIGGILVFGVLGLILGPLIIAYLLIFLEIYRNKKFTGLLIKAE